MGDKKAAIDGLVRGRMSEAEKAELLRLTEAGMKPGLVAKKLNRHHATINFALACMGLRAGPKRLRKDSYVRNGRLIVPFTQEEDEMIEQRRCEDWTYQQIADACWCLFGVRRSAATVGIRLKMLACEEAA